MFKHFLTAAWRNLKRNKLVSFIQIAGLSLGLATFILGARYLQFEKSFDNYHDNYERKYRLQGYSINDISNVSTQTGYPLAQYLEKTFPEIEKAINLREAWDELLSSKAGVTIHENDGYSADSKVFSFFNFEFIEGDPNTCLDNSNAIILTESLANKLFPNQQVIGKTIKSNLSDDLVVTALIKDIPPNTHIHPSYFVSSENRLKYTFENWDNNIMRTYVLLKPNTNLENFNKKIKTVVIDKVENYEWYLFLQPLEQLHLNPDNTGDLAVVLYLISSIVILILILSSVNFMNLSTAYSSVRSKEIGVRKVNGGNKKTLRRQYLFESVFYALMALTLALIISKLLLGVFNNIVDREIKLDYLNNPILLIIIVGTTLLTGFLSGIYPAYIISSFKPVTAIKGLNSFNNKKGKASGLRALVLVQFILSAILISASVWINSQVNYLKNKDIGFNKENLLHLKTPEQETGISYLDFKNMILSNPGIEKVCINKLSPMCATGGSAVYFEGQAENSTTYSRPNIVNADFINTMEIKLVQGRNFYENPEQNEGTCIINETAVKASGWKDDPIGKWVYMWGQKHKVVGVIKDINASDLHNNILPYILLPHDEKMNKHNSLIFRINTNSIASSYEHIKTVYSKIYPGHLFQIYTYDEAMDKLVFKIWTSVRNTSAFFTVIAILISVFALFALIVFATQKRKKEIGIRKVQGARFLQVYILLIREFIFIVIIAGVIAIPIPEIMADNMPGAYKYHLQFYEYLIIFIASLLVAVLTASYHAFKASSGNPVEALRYE